MGRTLGCDVEHVPVIAAAEETRVLTGDCYHLNGGVRGEDVQDKGGGVGLVGLVIHWGISELTGMTLLLVTVGDTEGADGVSGGIHG